LLISTRRFPGLGLFSGLGLIADVNQDTLVSDFGFYWLAIHRTLEFQFLSIVQLSQPTLLDRNNISTRISDAGCGGLV